jgi:hypothetical protein
MLTGCGSSADLRDKLGLNHQGPDEYRVVPRPPLSLPPDFSLRPPGQETQYASGMAADTRAHDQVLGDQAQGPGTVRDLSSTAVTPVTASVLPSGQDAQFLTDIKANAADPNIRQKLQSEKSVTAQDPNYLFGGKRSACSRIRARISRPRQAAIRRSFPPRTRDCWADGWVTFFKVA